MRGRKRKKIAREIARWRERKREIAREKESVYVKRETAREKENDVERERERW